MYAGPGRAAAGGRGGWHAVAAGWNPAPVGYAADAGAGLTGQAWSGPSSLLMTAATTPYVEWLSTAAAQAAQTRGQAYAAAAAYEAAFAMTVPPPVIAANRAQLMALIATNFFGQNAPAIAAAYREASRYIADVGCKTPRHVWLAAACETTSALLKPIDEPPQTTNTAGQSDQQTQAVVQAAGNASGAHTQTLAQLSASRRAQQLTTAEPIAPRPNRHPRAGQHHRHRHQHRRVRQQRLDHDHGRRHQHRELRWAPLSVNPGSTIHTIIDCSEGGVLIPGGVNVTAGSSPIILTPGSFPGGSRQPSSTAPPHFPVVGAEQVAVRTIGNIATAIVGPAGASITNVFGTVTVATVTPIASSPGALGAAFQAGWRRPAWRVRRAFSLSSMSMDCWNRARTRFWYRVRGRQIVVTS